MLLSHDGFAGELPARRHVLSCSDWSDVQSLQGDACVLLVAQKNTEVGMLKAGFRSLPVGKEIGINVRVGSCHREAATGNRGRRCV